MNMVQREVEQIFKQMNKTRKELNSLEGRLEGLTSTLKQMILNEQLVCSKIKYTKSPTKNKNVTQFKSSKGCFFKFQCQDGEYGEEIEEDARSNISCLSNTTLTDHDAEKQNGDIIHEEIDDLYSKVIR